MITQVCFKSPTLTKTANTLMFSNEVSVRPPEILLVLSQFLQVAFSNSCSLPFVSKFSERDGGIIIDGLPNLTE